MPIGAEIRGSHGYQQVGKRTPLLVVAAKGQVTSAANDGSIQLATSIAYIPTPNSGAILAFRPQAPMAQMSGGGSGSFRLAGTAPVGTVIDYWIFDRAANGLVYPSNVRFETRHPDTLELIYSSLMRPLRVAGIISPNPTATFTGTSGRTYAAVQARLANRLVYEPGTQRDFFRLVGIAGAAAGTADGLTVTDYKHGQEAETDAPDYSRERTVAGTLMAVDVTNF
jgi:hypothetical protein